LHTVVLPAKKADAIVVAPATANTIAKLALGLADNLLTTTVLASPAPLVIAPAMEAAMWSHPATQGHAHVLAERGAHIVGPAYGRLASGRVGAGRMVEPPQIVEAIRQTLGRDGSLAGVRVVITAGGTQEPLDPVRHLGNRSSGRMGYALAEAARDAGARVTLISAPTCLEQVYGVETVPVRTAQEMHDAVMDRLDQTDALIMAAAVADYRPARRAAQKIKKQPGDMALELERTTDILAAVAATGVRRPPVVVGFAAETENLLQNARAKLHTKELDMIVANDVSSSDSGFEVETNRATILSRAADPEALPLQSKFEVAGAVIARVAAYWTQRNG